MPAVTLHACMSASACWIGSAVQAARKNFYTCRFFATVHMTVQIVNPRLACAVDRQTHERPLLIDAGHRNVFDEHKPSM